MEPTYRWHRQFLQLLQWRHPGPLVLKSGAHLWALPALMAEYPDAVLVQTHRDPTRVVASLSSLFTAIRSTASDDVTIADVAAEFGPAIADAFDRSVDARIDGHVPRRPRARRLVLPVHARPGRRRPVDLRPRRPHARPRRRGAHPRVPRRQPPATSSASIVIRSTTPASTAPTTSTRP